MTVFSGLSLEQWEKRQVLKDCSRAYYIGSESALIFGRFARALWWLTETNHHEYLMEDIWANIKRGLGNPDE